jgi:hypothetical protein
MATELLGAKGLGIMGWSSRWMLCMSEEERHGDITMGSKKRGRRRRRDVGGWMGSSQRRKARHKEQGPGFLK